VSASEAEGRGFESRLAHQFQKIKIPVPVITELPLIAGKPIKKMDVIL
jgi:hypothetical protein